MAAAAGQLAHLLTMAARVALIGYGLAGEAFHAPLIDSVDGLELAAVVTRDGQRRGRARAEYPSAEMFDGADDIWRRADEFELVVVAAPNRAHVPLTLAALEAGLPVVLDKPMAGGAEEGVRLVKAAREAGLMLTVFQNRRWDGDLLTAKNLIAAGELGEVHRFEARFERWRPELREGWRERGDPGEAGGLLFDLGSHLVDQALHLFGPVATVYAELDARRPGSQVDDDVFLALTHRAGVRSHLWSGYLAAQSGPRLRLLGDRAAYVKHGVDVQEAALRSHGRPGRPGWGEDPEEAWGLLGSDEERRPVRTEPGSYERFYDGVAAALLEGAPPPVDPEDSVAGLRVLDAARQSARERRVVELASD